MSGLGPILPQSDLILTNYTCTDPISRRETHSTQYNPSLLLCLLRGCQTSDEDLVPIPGLPLSLETVVELGIQQSNPSLTLSLNSVDT